MGRMLGNWRTTAWGFAAGVAFYLTTTGVKMPTTRAEWGTFLVGALLAGWAAVSKDAHTGSAPGETK